MSAEYIIDLKENAVLCKEGDQNCDLYILHEGKLLICIRKGTQVIALAHVEPGEFLGELSFFDGQVRSADVIALEPCKLIRISPGQLKQNFPRWLVNLAQFQTKKLRVLNEVIRKSGIKKKSDSTISPLSIEDQRKYLEIINNA